MRTEKERNFYLLQVSLRFFPRGNLKLLLTSPMGTTSTLLFERPRDVLSSNFDDWPFLSVHFWGEKADGRWTLQVINAGNRHVNSPGKLHNFLFLFLFLRALMESLEIFDIFFNPTLWVSNLK